MLTILNDPAGITGRRRFAWDRSASVQANIERHLDAGGDCAVIFNGLRIDPATDPRMDDAPQETDQVFVMQRPAGIGPEGWILIISALLTVVAYSMIPRLPQQQQVNESPNNQLSGQTNVARPYQAIPDVYGYRRVWPDLIQPSLVEYRDHVKMVTEWLCVSRGTGAISDVRYADTPIIDVAGASWSFFKPSALEPSDLPELQSTFVTDLLEPVRVPDVNGQEISAVTYPSAVVANCDYFGAYPAADQFQLTTADGAQWATLKAAIPTTARIVYSTAVYGVDDITGENFAYVCDVLSYSVAGGLVTFTVRRPYGPPTPGYMYLTGVQVFAASTTTSAIGPFTIPALADRLRWNLAFLRGLKGTVSIQARWWAVDSLGAEISGTSQTQTKSFTADTYDERHWTVDVTPSAGLARYRVEFTRTTADLGNGADVCKLEDLYGMRYYAERELPGVTVLRVITTATEQATGIRERKFNLRWHRYVRQLGSPDTLGLSRNFARAIAHMWLVSGGDLAELDIDKMAEINASLGEDSPLLRFDGSLDDANMSLGERMQAIANHARCTIWRDGTRWTLTREQAQSVPELQLDYRNLAAGGESLINYAAHLPESHDGVEVEYVAEDTQASKAYVRLSIATGTPVAGTPGNPLKLRLSGCATLEQAENRARLEARRLLYQRTSVTDTALCDAGSLGIGSLVRWVDPNDFAGDDGLQAGEVMAIDGATLTTSEPLDWKGATSGRMLLTGEDGRFIFPPVVCTPGAAADQVVIAAPPSGLYVRDATRQLGSRYSFGPGLTESEIQASGLYVVTNLQPAEDQTTSLALAAYDDRLFEDD